MELYNRLAAGERIRKRRILLGMTQEEMAEKIGRAYKYYQDIERGSCGISVETLIKLGSALNISLDYIIYGNQDNDIQTPWILLEQESVLEMLGGCSEKQRRIALEILRLYLKGCSPP